MSERYSRVFLLQGPLYAQGAPLILSAGAILRDDQTGGVLAQLKFRSISSQVIRAVKVKITPQDAFANPLGEAVEYAYLDLNAHRDEQFGQNVPVLLPDPATRSFGVAVTEAAFGDGRIWQADGSSWEVLTRPVPITKAVPDAQLRRQIQLEYGNAFTYMPISEKDLWICACGEVNREAEAVCALCRQSFARLQGLDMEALKANRDERLAKEAALIEARRAAAEAEVEARRAAAAAEEARKQAMKEAEARRKQEAAEAKAAKKRAAAEARAAKKQAAADAKAEKKQAAAQAREAKKQARTEKKQTPKNPKKRTALLVPVLAVVLVAAVLIFGTSRTKKSAYKEAMALVDGGQLTAGIDLLKEAGYRDAMEQVYAHAYKNAEKLLDAGDFEAAQAAFEALGTYSDAQARIGETVEGQKQVLYRLAEALAEAGDFDGAIEQFEALGDFSDSPQRILQIRYQKAETLLEQGETGRAAMAFYEIVDYQDARERSFQLWDSMRPYEGISASYMDTYAVTEDGNVLKTGNSKYSLWQVGDWSDMISVSGGDWHVVGLKADGTVVAVGENSNGQCQADWNQIISISAGAGHTVGLKENHTVVAVGLNEDGQCDVSDWGEIVAVSAGSDHTVGLRADGTVVAVGDNLWGQCNVSDWKDIVAISAGQMFTMGLKADGTVVVVGQLHNGLTNFSGWNDIVAISAGVWHAVGLKSDGTVLATGYSGFDGEYDAHSRLDVTEWKNIVSISAGHHTVGLQADGTVLATGWNGYGQCNVLNWEGVRLPNTK